MTRWCDTLRASLLLMIAAVAPWDVFLFIPGLNLRLTSMLAVAVIALEFVDVLHARRIGVRFELLWPACALLLLALLPTHPLPMHGVTTILLGLVAARSAGPLLSHNALAVFALSTSIMALCTVAFTLAESLAPGSFLAPAAYSLDTGILAPFGHSVTECAVLFLLGFAASATRCRGSGSASAPLRLLPGASLISLGLALLILAALSVNALAFWQPRDYLASYGTALAALIGGWLLARILAKLWVCWRETHERAYAESAAVLSALVVAALLLPVEFRLFWGLAGGMAAGTAQSQKDLAPPPRRWLAALIPVAVLVGVNFAGVHPADTAHPRHYEAAAHDDFARGDFVRLERRMDYVESHWQEERRTHLWRARLALAEGLLHEAAYEFTLAVQPEDAVPLLFPPPEPAEADAFLVRLRDACSKSRSETASLAHIQALAGAQKLNHAATLIEQVLKEADSIPLPDGLDPDLEIVAHGCPCSWPLRTAVLQTVWPADAGSPRELDRLLAEDVSGSQWLRLLLSWGAELHTASSELLPETLPLIAIAKCHRASIELICISGDTYEARTEAMADMPRPYDPAARYAAFELVSDGPPPIWRDPERCSAGACILVLDINGEPVATVRIHNGIAMTSQPLQTPLPVHDIPAIHIWL